MDNSLFLLWVQFGVLGAVIFAAGSQVTKYGDVIAEKTGLGRLFIGVVLVATATSLPELFVGIGSTAIAKLPDLAVGDVLGSCIFNLLLLVVADYAYGRKPILSHSAQGHILSAAFGVLMLTLVALFLLNPEYFSTLQFARVGLATPIIAAVYLASITLIFNYERNQIAGYIERTITELHYEHITMRVAWLGYAASAAIVIAAALYLPGVAGRLAQETGWGDSFMGTIFMAFTTSLPELVVVIAAVRMNAGDIAVANVFGSNLFNILVLAIDDLFYRPGVLLSNVSAVHLDTIVAALGMYGLAMVALIYRVKRRSERRLEWESVGIVILFLLNALFIFQGRGS